MKQIFRWQGGAIMCFEIILRNIFEPIKSKPRAAWWCLMFRVSCMRLNKTDAEKEGGRCITEWSHVENTSFSSPPVSSHPGAADKFNTALLLSETRRYKMSSYDSQQVTTLTNRTITCFNNKTQKHVSATLDTDTIHCWPVLYIVKLFGATSWPISYTCEYKSTLHRKFLRHCGRWSLPER